MMIILLLVYLAESTCPAIMCNSLETGAVALDSDGSVYVNFYGCPVGTYGSVESLMSWFKNNGTVLFCHTLDTPSLDSSESIDCLTFPGEELLADTVYPKRCNSSTDCLLKDGGYVDCLCGLDGYSYCMPGWGADVFDGYWEYCDKHHNKTPQTYWQYYKDLHTYYNYWIMAPSCAQTTFIEFVTLQAGLPNSGLYIIISYGILITSLLS
ncbi:unnamed protein product [Blepharisma stoltei]|uniref:EGF-like domain-containing protein n=1 Tax=Blepharisma stoltei TaxID=1481888 RepID=A0AAU9JFL9_9CILI|nr:unnamed protein product [Blepharisma stoltei]